MGWLKTLLTGGDTVKAIGDTVDKLFTSDDERLERANEKDRADKAYQLELAKLDSIALSNQTDVNKIEAASTRLFVAGWRPAIGWICGAGLAYASFIEPAARFIAKLSGYEGDFPAINTDITLQVLIGMLGLGVYRTFEKSKGVS